MRDKMEISATPTDEACEQFGVSGYNCYVAKAECEAFKNQLYRQFPIPEEAQGVAIVVTSNPYDGGSYYEVAVRYDTDNSEQFDYALRIEHETPMAWDRQAIEELLKSDAVKNCNRAYTFYQTLYQERYKVRF